MSVRKFFIHVILSPVYFYRYAISPLIPPRCRFVPSCSQYVVEAFSTHGVIKGGGLSCKRLCKCHPFSRAHGYDPVPKK